MSEARLAASLDGLAGAPVLVLANPIGTTRAIWAAQVPGCSGISACSDSNCAAW